MKRLGVLAVGLVVASCRQTPVTPTPTPVSLSPIVIWGELVEAGCVADDDAGAATVSQEEALDADVWLTCMASGGSVQACDAPCN